MKWANRLCFLLLKSIILRTVYLSRTISGRIPSGIIWTLDKSELENELDWPTNLNSFANNSLWTQRRTLHRWLLHFIA